MHLKELDANLIVVLDALLIDASVTKAAERLGRSPSAVSHALANLRHIFDDQLFVRAGQRLTPTVKARELAATVHVIVSGLESLLRPTEPFDPANQDRTFLIASSELAELYLLPKLRSDVAVAAPGVRLERHGVDSPQFLDELRHGRIDFALIEGRIEQDVPDMQWAVLQQEPFQTLMPKKSIKGRGGCKVDKKTFLTKPHILTQLSGKTSSQLEETFLDHKLPEARLQKVTSSLLASLLAFEMDGLVTVPRLHADMIARHIDMEVVQLPFELPTFDIHLGWHRRFERDECHSWLRAKIERHFKADEVVEETVS